MANVEQNMTEQHMNFFNKSRLSFLSVMLGMTICFSTLWRFPYQVTNFGGAAFILIYIVLSIVLVFPALTAEWGIGRFTKAGPEEAYKKLNLPYGKAIGAGLVSIVVIIGSYFAVWIGWILQYAIRSLTDPQLITSTTNSNAYFDSQIAANPLLQLVFAGIVILLVAPTLLGGTNRIERLSRIIVPMFYILTVIITLLVLLQSNVLNNTIKFLTTINISAQVTPFTFVAALGQAFFSLCLGGTWMVLYSSYMQKNNKHDIPTNALLTILGNIIASLIAVFLVVGIVFMSGLNAPDSLAAFGPGLFFGVIPEAFQALSITTGPTIAALLMALFFVMFFFAAYLPMTANLAVGVTGVEHTFGLSHRKAFVIIAIVTLLLAIPSALSPLEGGFLYNLDIFIGGIGSVIGSIIAILAFAWFIDKKLALDEINLGSRFKLGEKYHFMIKYIVPVFMIIVVFYALSDIVLRVTGLNGLNASDYILYTTITNIIPLITVFLGVLVIILITIQTIISRRKTAKMVTN